MLQNKILFSRIDTGIFFRHGVMLLYTNTLDMDIFMSLKTLVSVNVLL